MIKCLILFFNVSGKAKIYPNVFEIDLFQYESNHVCMVSGTSAGMGHRVWWGLGVQQSSRCGILGMQRV